MTCVLSASGLRYRYPDGREALKGIDLSVSHGERVAVLGPNGAGKTTFVYHLNGLLRGSGRLEVAGVDAVDDKSIRELHSRVGLVFQDPDDQLFMPTVREDVAFGPLNLGLTREQTLDRVEEALAAVRMSHAVDRAPHQLSMGERRRVAIATVLAMQPELLVLDEPTANLDPRARRELLQVLERIDRTMLVVTHDLPFAAELCERAVILSAGSIVADGPCAQVLGDRRLLARHDLELPAGFDSSRLSTARSREQAHEAIARESHTRSDAACSASQDWPRPRIAAARRPAMITTPTGSETGTVATTM
jgi:cobalt/nickel transport system ATP-binding protein